MELTSHTVLLARSFREIVSFISPADTMLELMIRH